MRSLRGVVGIVAVIAKLRTTNAHPGCFTPNETPNLEAELTFCPLDEVSGACCTPTQEQDALAVFNQYGPLTDDCADHYKQVVCGVCNSYSIHLYEVLGNDLGLADGMTMKRDFCDDLVSTCNGQISFPTYNGESYCDTHVVGDDDLFWSYPIDDSITSGFTSEGLVKAFPDLDDSDLPNKLIAMHMTPDGSEWWMAGQTGEMKKVSSSNPSGSTMVLDISDGVNLVAAFEEGLLDFALSPDFHNNDYFYCSYTVLDDGRRNRLARFTYNSGSADDTKDSIYILLTSPAKFSTIHSAGWVGFKPSDYGSQGVHDLYWAIGDGGPQEDSLRRGGDSSNILASIVRIQVSTNSDAVQLNPSGNKEGPVCASGFRNPFRCSFDSETDDLYCADVGHTLVEEIDLVVCGNDYGWSRFEGSRCQEAQQDDFDEQCASLSRSGLTFPIFEYCHPDYISDVADEDEFTGGNDICGSRSIVGNAVIAGHVYHGQKFGEVLGGALVFSEAQKGNLYYLFKEGGEWIPGTIISDGSESIISFAEANDGELFVIHSDRTPYMLPCGDLCATTCLEQIETQPEYESLGCFGDFNNNRALTLAKGANCPEGEDLMSPAICSSFCATQTGATLFGVEYAFECFCGSASDNYAKHGALDSDSCGTLCTGTPDEFCGGSNSIEVYSFSDGVPDTPSPISPPGPTTPTPPTPTPTEFTSLGCFEDSKTDRVLSIKMAGGSTLTTEGCADLCEGSTYFGTEFGVECFCSAEGDTTTGIEPATCDMDCAGDAAETCGGRNAISLYQFSDISPTPVPPTPTPTSDAYTSKGCFVDDKKARVLDASSTNSGAMTTEACAAFCVGLTYFGTQYGTECWCGDDEPDIQPAVCNLPCPGDASQVCGGYNALSVYEFTETSPTPGGFEGCYTDTKSARIMGSSVASNDGMTIQVCSGLCPVDMYYGLQYGTECFCSDFDDFMEADPSTSCTFACAGDSAQICGGKFAMSVFSQG